MLLKAKKLYQAALDHTGFKRYFKNTSWLFGGQMFRMVLGLFVSVAVARHLGPKDFGLFNYVMSIVTLISFLAQLGLRDLAKRELVESPERRNEIMGTCFVLNLVAGAVIYTVMLLIVFGWSDRSLVISLFALLGCTLLTSSLNYVELWFQSQVRSDLSVLAASSSLVVFAALKIFAITQGAGLIIFGYLFFCEIVSVCLLRIYFYIRHFGSILQWQAHWATAMTFLKHSWPLMLTSLAIVIYKKVDQIMLGAMLNEDAVGQYSVAVTISSVFHIIPSILAVSLFPAILNARSQDKVLYGKRLQNYFDLNASLAYLIAVSLSIAAPWVVLILFGQEYQQAGKILVIHAWSSIFVFSGVARNQYLLAEKLFKFSMLCTVSGAVVNLILNYIIIPKYGGQGAAVTTLISYTVSNLLSTFFILNSFPLLKRQLFAFFIPVRLLLIKSATK